MGNSDEAPGYHTNVGSPSRVSLSILILGAWERADHGGRAGSQRGEDLVDDATGGDDPFQSGPAGSARWSPGGVRVRRCGACYAAGFKNEGVRWGGRG